MNTFLNSWHLAAKTTCGLFWMAFWAFALGYLISSMIQVFVTRRRMREAMGETGPRSVFLGTFFGFISSSCSFAALSTTRSLFAKGAGLIPALAFMLSSTNLVIELGIIIAVFLSWQFVVGEYLGGLLLIGFMWFLVRLTLSRRFEEEAREHARDTAGMDDETETEDWRRLIASARGWRCVARQYGMEWGMVWKDVSIGFTVAGIIAAFVPRTFFEALFLSAGGGEAGFIQVLAQAVIGPVAAFFTFIGSMGNIPLAAVLFSNGVSFAGVMAFIFSDLVVFPVLRVQSTYYGWKMAAYILVVMLCSLVATAVLLHYGFHAAGMLPDATGLRIVTERSFFQLDYTSGLNAFFLLMTGGFWVLTRGERHDHHMDHGGRSLGALLLSALSFCSFGWLAVGLALPAFS